MDVRRQWDQNSPKYWHMAHIPIGIRGNRAYIQQTGDVLKKISQVVRRGGHDVLYVYDKYAIGSDSSPSDGFPIQMCGTSTDWLLSLVHVWENLWIAVCKRHNVTLKVITSDSCGHDDSYVPWSQKRRKSQVEALVKNANSQSH
jgi:hypothetical protein